MSTQSQEICSGFICNSHNCRWALPHLSSNYPLQLMAVFSQIRWYALSGNLWMSIVSPSTHLSRLSHPSFERGKIYHVVVPVAGLLRKKSGPSEDITTLPMRHHKGRYYYQIWLADQNRDTTSLGINTGWFLCLSNIENSALKITLHQAALLKESLPNGAVTRLFQ